MNVRWLPKETVAGSASEVLQGYARLVARPVQPPIPIEDIIERYMGLTLRFEDLSARLHMEGVVGAIFIADRTVSIHEELLEDKRREGRMMFTCAHEAGHWILHRHFANRATRMGDHSGAIICRTKDARLPVEWQADYFASCLLMPEKEVKGAFSQVWGGTLMVLDNVRSSLGGTAFCVDPCVRNWPLIADAVREAGRFSNVSKEAMIIRLKELGLVRNKTNARVGWQRTA
jgi:hypothetical protein